MINEKEHETNQKVLVIGEKTYEMSKLNNLDKFIELNEIVKVWFPIVKYVSVMNVNDEIFRKILSCAEGLTECIKSIFYTSVTLNPLAIRWVIRSIFSIMNKCRAAIYHMEQYSKINGTNTKDFIGYEEFLQTKAILKNLTKTVSNNNSEYIKDFDKLLAEIENTSMDDDNSNELINEKINAFISISKYHESLHKSFFDALKTNGSSLMEHLKSIVSRVDNNQIFTSELERILNTEIDQILYYKIAEYKNQCNVEISESDKEELLRLTSLLSTSDFNNYAEIFKEILKVKEQIDKIKKGLN